MPEPASRPTVVTVARLAGVSVASVSRVLNGGTATPRMEQRVRSAAAQLGYVPDAAARSLRAGRTHQLAFAVADLGNPTYVDMMRGVEAVTSSSGYRLLVHSTGSDPADEISLIESLGHRYVDGLILSTIRITAGLLRALALAPAPIVLVGNVPDFPGIDSVCLDSGPGVTSAVEHLLAGGRRSLALVDGPLDTIPGADRSRAFEAAVKAAGLPADPGAIEYAADFTFAAGLVAARRLLDRLHPDAVVCGNDLIAFAVLRALAEAELRVPDDVAVIGVDDTELAAMNVPSLTSVSIESKAQGRLAAQLISDRIANPDLAPRREIVLPRLVVRTSSRQKPGHAGPAGVPGESAPDGRMPAAGSHE
jgi:LacI family transcriptional regulator